MEKKRFCGRRVSFCAATAPGADTDRERFAYLDELFTAY